MSISKMSLQDAPLKAYLRMPAGCKLSSKCALGEDIEIKVLQDASGALFLDVQTLRARTGICTFDPGFGSTASCSSQLTFIDGSAGVLLYRGYSIYKLAQLGDFADSCFLLLHGDLPNAEQKLEFTRQLCRHTLVNEQLVTFFKGFRHDAHPMAMMVGVVGSLAAFYQDSDISSPDSRLKQCVLLISKIPTLAAMAYKTAVGLPIMYPCNARLHKSFAEHLLYMMFAVPSEEYVVDPIRAKALELFIILHMDHEQNASTSTVRTAGSSQANPFVCVASGIATLWGPAHGGANEAVIRMLEEIGSKDNIEACLLRAKDKEDPFRLMGFGHRVYKTYDPRAAIMRDVCYQLMEQLDIKEDPLLDIAMALAKAATTDEYFVNRSLYPNVDFFSGIVLRILGIPLSMFTCMFAVARSVGWVAQWKEMSDTGIQRISRPRQMYMGHMQRDYLPLEERVSEEVPQCLSAGQSTKCIN